MNFYIALAILAVFIIWLLISTEKEWALGGVASIVCGSTWLIVGVVTAPLEAPYTETTVKLENPPIGCTQRMCEVRVGNKFLEVEDAYRYNLLKDSTYTNIAVSTQYSWWGDVVNEKLIVE